ncbi:MAG: dephospho-CoA kinase [Acidobacteriia bacterium]|nr:dephospho-CoA kinase [Methyloceanibacter sp.]MBX5471592.1 dephospho-CoA kinase [Acetobacteraceae bacterium]MCL6491499.1 dephospho-CoA kinase [Terriglobia bacterium]
MCVIGLTGGMGMGKSTAASFFRRAGIPTFDADAEVRALQAPGGRAMGAIAAAFPSVVEGDRLDRTKLRALVMADPEALKRLEGILHPMVRKAEQAFLARVRRSGKRIAVLDIPLLFETGAEKRVHKVVVVSAPLDVQIARLRRRSSWSEAEIRAAIARQMPDREKRRRADFVIKTGLSRFHSVRALRRLIRELRRCPAPYCSIPKRRVLTPRSGTALSK